MVHKLRKKGKKCYQGQAFHTGASRPPVARLHVVRGTLSALSSSPAVVNLVALAHRAGTQSAMPPSQGGGRLGAISITLNLYGLTC